MFVFHHLSTSISPGLIDEVGKEISAKATAAIRHYEYYSIMCSNRIRQGALSHSDLSSDASSLHKIQNTTKCILFLETQAHSLTSSFQVSENLEDKRSAFVVRG